jgi:hypothetical protein
VWSARTALTEAADALAAIRAARAQLDAELEAARRGLSYAEDRARRAGIGVIAAEELEPLIEAAVASRASYWRRSAASHG